MILFKTFSSVGIFLLVKNKLFNFEYNKLPFKFNGISVSLLKFNISFKPRSILLSKIGKEFIVLKSKLCGLFIWKY
jgi:hypothetical protein